MQTIVDRPIRINGTDIEEGTTIEVIEEERYVDRDALRDSALELVHTMQKQGYDVRFDEQERDESKLVWKHNGFIFKIEIEDGTPGYMSPTKAYSDMYNDFEARR